MAEPPNGIENSALRELRQELQNDAAVDRFVTDFLALLDHRLTELDRLVGQVRHQDAATVLLTIQTSSQMIGAHELAMAAADLRQALEDPASPETSALLERVHVAAVTTRRLFDQG